MPTSKPSPNPVTIHDQGDGMLEASWPIYRYRFLFSDGRTVDVLANRDDSHLREAMLNFTGAERIEGVARLEPGK